MYIRKEFESKWLFGALKFSLTSEDRENGEYKHMIELSFLWKKLMSIVFRTGNGKSSMGFFWRANKEHSFMDAVSRKLVKAKESSFGSTEFTYEPSNKAFKQVLTVDDEAKKSLYYEELKSIKDHNKGS